MNALGLIEVNGYLAAVEAADAALKAANVKLIGLEVIKAGITAVQITGDVGAVKASVDAGKLAAERLGLLRAAHVIPRLHSEVVKLFPTMNSKENEKRIKIEEISNKVHTQIDKIENVSAEIIKEATDNISDEELNNEIKEVVEEIKDKAEDDTMEEVVSSVGVESLDYNSMRVDELRSLVRKLNIANMTNKQIKFARKDELIDILLKYKKEGEK